MNRFLPVVSCNNRQVPTFHHPMWLHMIDKLRYLTRIRSLYHHQWSLKNFCSKFWSSYEKIIILPLKVTTIGTFRDRLVLSISTALQIVFLHPEQPFGQFFPHGQSEIALS